MTYPACPVESIVQKQISKDEIYSNSSSSDDEPPNAVVTKSPKIKQDDSIEPGAADNTDAADSVSDKKCDEDPQSFVNEMKRAADQMAGFMYEPTSGLYYDCKTGYYFNAVSKCVDCDSLICPYQRPVFLGLKTFFNVM